MSNFFKNNTKLFVGFAIGLAVAIFVFTFEKGETKAFTPGSIPISKAEVHARDHFDHLPTSWRIKSHGVWYDSGRLNDYLYAIDQYNYNNKDLASKLGYELKVAICFGAARKKKSEDKRLMTIFMPVLIYKEVNGQDTLEHTLNVFEAREHWQKKDSVMPDWEKKRPKGHTYFTLYQTFYEAVDGERKRDTTQVFFNDGNMFP